ncbi:unnamed protein product [Blepharisma stoltei]|uniref:STIL N-terminal domain-containing protein n=1 Tax=Blepharisma stoltei TaxID=1481888 RepID=A0AAU9IPB5_9CILI|nr:unnamed protein product [Blepharisma stoltei]
MSYIEGISEYQEEFTPFSREINLNAVVSDLWPRQPQGKRFVLRMNSILPQFKITNDVLRSLWDFSNNPESHVSGLMTAFKYSPSHYLSLKTQEVSWLSRGEPTPIADYLIPLIYQHELNAEHLHIEEKIIENMMNSIDRRINREKLIEPLDILRVCAAFSADEKGQRLLLKCELLFPAVTLQFTPIAPLKLVSTPLSIKLTKNSLERYQYGFLTLDQSGRALPLLITDPLAYKYPLVGVWVSGVPESKNSKQSSIVHPLVWAACVQFIESKSIREKISPSPEDMTILFLHFNGKPKYYEVSCQGISSWKTTSFVAELPMEEGEYFSPCFVTFLREDQSVSSLEISLASIRKSTIKNSVLYGKSPKPIACPPRPPSQLRNQGSSFMTIRSSSARNRSSDSYRKYSPDSERIISQQSKMLAQLQAQIHELQEQVFKSQNPSKSSYPNILNFVADSRTSASSGTNTSIVANNPPEEPHHCEESPNFASKMASKRLKEGKPPHQQATSARQYSNKKNYPKLITSGSEDRLHDSNENHHEMVHYNSSSEFQESPDESPIPVKSKLMFSPLTKTNPASSTVQISSTCQTKLTFSPSSKTQAEIKPKESPSVNKVLNVSNILKPNLLNVESSDKTICVPKINYESGSESSDDDMIEAVERKYLSMK